MPNNHLINEENIPGNWQPVDKAAVVPGQAPKDFSAPPVPHEMPQFFSGSIAPGLQHDGSFVGTEVGSPRIPKHSLMPFGAQANPFVNAATKSITINNPTPSGGSGGGATQATLNIPSIFTPVTQTVTLPGPLAFTLASEPANTALAGPPAGLSGLEAVVAGAVGPSTLGGVGISVTAAPTTATSWGLFAYYTNAGASPTPTGWATITGSDPIFTKSLTGFSPITVTETVPALNNGGLSTLAIFAGAQPSIVQNASDGFSYLGAQTKAFPSANTAGNTLLIVMYSAGDTLGIAPSLSASDTNGNTYTALSNLAYGGTITNVHGNNQGLSQQILIAVNCAAGANSVIWNVGGQIAGGRTASLYMYELGPLASGPGLPFFRQLGGGDFSGFDATKILSGLVPLSHGGTGADLSGTGGTGKVLKQSAAGAAVTVGALAFTELTGSVATTANVQNGFANASLGPTTLYSANGNFLYEITYNLVTVSAGTAGTVTFTLTWNNGAAQTFTTSAVALATLGNYVSGSIILKSTGTPQWSTTVAGALGGPFYSIDIRVVPLG